MGNTEKSTHDLRVDYDDQPDQVAEKFIKALAKHGIIVENVNYNPEEPYLYYKITPTDKK